MRRASVAVLAAFLVAGLLGAWGPREGSASARSAGYEVEVTYPSVTRGGLATRWEVTVRRIDAARLPGEVVVAVSRSYDAIFDQRTIAPEPDRSWLDDDMIHRAFAIDGRTNELVVEIDGRIQPDQRWRHRATTVVSVGGATISVDHDTWLLP